MPAPLPGEILYSFLARTVLLNSLGPPRSALQLLFGASSIIPSVDMPTRIQALQERLGSFSPFRNVADLIERATLYPYYRPFLTPECYARSYETIRRGDARGLKTLLGLVASRFGASTAIRFCPVCYQEDLAQLGVTYWHKQPQLPAVTVCSVHRVNLIEGPPQSHWSHRQRLELPANAGNFEPAISCRDQHHIRFADLSGELLDAHLSPLDPECRRDAYIEAARSLGYTGVSGRLDWDALATGIRDHFDDFETFPHRERLISPGDVSLCWLKPVILRTARVSHPILHLLLIEFLFSSIASFRTAVDRVRESRLGTHVVHSAPLLAFSRDEHLLRDTRWSCRRLATALGVSTTTVVLKRRALGIPVSERRKSLNRAAIVSVERDLRDGMSVEQVARKHGVSVASIYRIRRSAPALTEKLLEGKRMAERFKHRQDWRKCLHHFGAQGITAARAASPATYGWLYRNDRDWLHSVRIQTRRTPSHHAARVDWRKRDHLLAQNAKTLVLVMKNAPTRPRITSTHIVRELGCQAMMRANGPHLPELQLTLRSLTESAVDFQKHRIRIAVAYIRGRHLDPTLWRIQREAHLKKWTPALKTFALRTLLNPK